MAVIKIISDTDDVEITIVDKAMTAKEYTEECREQLIEALQQFYQTEKLVIKEIKEDNYDR